MMPGVRRGLVALGILALVAAAAVAPPTETLASWTPRESAGGSFAAKVIPAPTPVAPCTVSNTILGVFQSVTLRWSPPAGSGYTAANASLGLNSSIAEMVPLASQPTINGPACGPYSVTFTSTLLQSLLENLLGSTFYVGVRSTENGWTSTWSTRTVNVGLLGLGSSCT